MRLTKVTTTVSDLANEKPGYEALFLVDTGATHCMAPASELKKAGIAVKGRNAYELANGPSVEYDYGYAIVSFLGNESLTKVIFGPENTEPILGVLALEDVGIGVDPVNNTLKKMPAIPLKKLSNSL